MCRRWRELLFWSGEWGGGKAQGGERAARVRGRIAAAAPRKKNRSHARSLSFPASYVHYCMDRVDVMLRAGVKPIIIFDGGRLPAKAAEEASRHR